jgi:hypothetical protein
MEFEAGVFRIDALMIFARRSRSASALAQQQPKANPYLW